VLSWISQDPTEFGFPTGWWTAPRLADLVRRRFNVSMNHRYLNHWLRHRHISPQIPEAQPAERDQIRIDAWVRWQWPWIKRQAQALRATLGFTDETGFLLCPLIRSTQAPTGHTPLLLHRAKQRDKVSAVGALTLSPQQGHVGLYFQTYPNDYVNNDLYALFLRNAQRRPGAGGASRLSKAAHPSISAIRAGTQPAGIPVEPREALSTGQLRADRRAGNRSDRHELVARDSP
jgi:hypothetical protein